MGGAKANKAAKPKAAKAAKAKAKVAKVKTSEDANIKAAYNADLAKWKVLTSRVSAHVHLSLASCFLTP